MEGFGLKETKLPDKRASAPKQKSISTNHDTVTTGGGLVGHIVVEWVVEGGSKIASPEKNVTGGARSNEGRTFIKMPPHLVKTPDSPKILLKHGTLLEGILLPDTDKTTRWKNWIAKKSILGAKTWSILSGTMTAEGIVAPNGEMDGRTCPDRGNDSPIAKNASSRIGLEMATFFTKGSLDADHRILWEVSDSKESFKESVTTGGGATGTEPVLPPISTGAKAKATETTLETSGVTDKEVLVTSWSEHVKKGAEPYSNIKAIEANLKEATAEKDGKMNVTLIDKTSASAGCWVTIKNPGSESSLTEMDCWGA